MDLIIKKESFYVDIRKFSGDEKFISLIKKLSHDINDIRFSATAFFAPLDLINGVSDRKK
ncbi:MULTISPECIES: hypothetical protein [Legionella]|uniref:hypothetical protein n=1 Tax=Legionella TaxID=445 RepID=UPI00096554AD|nr:MULTISPECIES: hypothetical protein [Legionella]MBN9226624.1 hypothetical protein [Legionella steelei]OJW15454.1 MAG: hypothetical protein BGO44_11445 [Legionella sp. 39-23]